MINLKTIAQEIAVGCLDRAGVTVKHRDTIEKCTAFVNKKLANLSSAIQSGSAIDAKDVEILNLISEGGRPADISDQLNISSRTIESRIQKLMRVFDAKTQAHLTFKAVELGFIQPTINQQ